MLTSAKDSSSQSSGAQSHNEKTLAKIRERNEREAREKAARERERAEDRRRNEAREARRAEEREEKEARRKREDDARDARRAAEDRERQAKRERDRADDLRKKEERDAQRKRDDAERDAKRSVEDKERQAKRDKEKAERDKEQAERKRERDEKQAAERRQKEEEKKRADEARAAAAKRQVQYTDVLSVDEIKSLSTEQRRRLTEFKPDDLQRYAELGKIGDVRKYVYGSDPKSPADAKSTGSSQRPLVPDRQPSTLPGSTHANSTQATPGPNTGYTRETVGAMAKEGGKLAYSVAPWLIPELKAVQVVKAAATADRGNVVYVAYKNGKAIYVGITNDLKRRVREHGYEEGVEVQAIDGLTDLTRTQARSVEQALIEKYGMLKDGGQLINQRNSISPLRDIYQESKATGESLLKDAKWPGF